MRCNNCGWENPNTNTKCEKCGAILQNENLKGGENAPLAESPLNKTQMEAEAFPDLGAQPAVTPKRDEVRMEPLRPKVAAEPQAAAADAYRGTVNPWIQVTPKSQCSLTPVAQTGDEAAPAPIVFKGEQHTLNRANLDAENPTITSQVQAELTCQDGKWYIQDRSAQGTTFIHVAERMALYDGDIILMGNRQFIFHSDR